MRFYQTKPDQLVKVIQDSPAIYQDIVRAHQVIANQNEASSHRLQAKMTELHMSLLKAGGSKNHEVRALGKAVKQLQTQIGALTSKPTFSASDLESLSLKQHELPEPRLTRSASLLQMDKLPENGGELLLAKNELLHAQRVFRLRMMQNRRALKPAIPLIKIDGTANVANIVHTMQNDLTRVKVAEIASYETTLSILRKLFRFEEPKAVRPVRQRLTRSTSLPNLQNAGQDYNVVIRSQSF